MLPIRRVDCYASIQRIDNSHGITKSLILFRKKDVGISMINTDNMA